MLSNSILLDIMLIMMIIPTMMKKQMFLVMAIKIKMKAVFGDDGESE